MIWSIVAIAFGCFFLAIGARFAIHVFKERDYWFSSFVDAFIAAYCIATTILYGSLLVIIGIVNF